jgi:sarcosine oxidase delta subunit
VRRIESDGRLLERWCHVAGCGQWFTAHRDLRTDTEATTA